MAGTAKKVIVSGLTEDVVRAIANSLNTLIDNFDAHTHGGVTAGGASTAAPTATTAGKIHDALSASQGAV
jgi:hypothetical protein